MMKLAVQIAALMAGFSFASAAIAAETPTGQATAEQLVSALEEGATIKSAVESLQEAVAQGATIDQAVAAVVQQNPEKATEVVSAAMGLLGQIPYMACDDCHCGSGNVAREYPVSELSGVDPKNWVDEVVGRYLEGKRQLMLPLYVSEKQEVQYYYHFKATAEMLAPYLQSEDKPSEQEIAKAVNAIKKNGFTEPVRLYLNASDHEAHIHEGRVLIEAAKRLGIQRLPLRFAFTDCILCEGRSEAAHYTVEEMRQYSQLQWTADRFFKRAEFVLVDKEYGGKYPFQYHYDASVDELLAHFSGTPDRAKTDEWKEKIKKGLQAPMDVTLQYWTKTIAFEEDAQAFLTAAKESGMSTVPVRASFQDQITCRSGQKKNSFSALELFPDNRIPLVAERFFRGKRRLVLDEIGRNRESAGGYPFGKPFTYNAMVNVDELKKYIRPEQMPSQDEIDKRAKELKDKGVGEALYVTLEKRKSDKPQEGKSLGQEEELIEMDKNSIITTLAAPKAGIPNRLPVRFLYIQARTKKNYCAEQIQQTCLQAGGSAAACGIVAEPPQDAAPAGTSPS